MDRHVLEDLLEEAYVAGFCASGEGYNGEYPFDFCKSRISRELSERRQEAVQEIIWNLACKTIIGGSDE